MQTFRTRYACFRGLIPLVLLPSWGDVAADGYRFGATYTGDVLSNVSGGIATGERYLDNLDLTLDIDVKEAWGFGAGRLFVYGLYNNGTTFSDELVGDLQVVSNIEATHAWRLYEFWYELGDRRWSVRTGLYDLNSEFDAHETGGLFLNSSHGIGADFGQTGKNGPSIFPVTSLAVRGAVNLDNIAVRIAIMDGVPGDPANASSNVVALGGDDGVLTVAEIDVPIGERGRLWSGYWRYSGEFDRPFGSGSTKGNHGWYVGIESALEVGSHSVSGFMRYGQANDQLNAVQDYLGAGLVLTGPIASRPSDQLGIAVASAGVGDAYRDLRRQTDGSSERRENIWELTYRAQISEHLVLQPDIQIIRNPAASSLIDDAVIVGLRFEIAY